MTLSGFDVSLPPGSDVANHKSVLQFLPQEERSRSQQRKEAFVVMLDMKRRSLKEGTALVILLVFSSRHAVRMDYKPDILLWGALVYKSFVRNSGLCTVWLL